MGGGVCSSGGSRRPDRVAQINVLKISVFGASDSEALRVSIRLCSSRLGNPSPWGGGVGNGCISNPVRAGGIPSSVCWDGFVS